MRHVCALVDGLWLCVCARPRHGGRELRTVEGWPSAAPHRSRTFAPWAAQCVTVPLVLLVAQELLEKNRDALRHEIKELCG